MEKERGSKIIAIIALCVGVIGLAVGFAAFSNTLTISSSASVKPDASTFNVKFVGSIGCVPDTGAKLTSAGTINDLSVTGLAVQFTQPSSITCMVSVENAGEYVAYLNSIKSDGMITCTKGANATQGLVDDACATISVTASVGTTATSSHGGEDATGTVSKTAALNVSTITGHTLDKGATESVVLTINYAGPARADGDFTVNIPEISLVYDSVEK